MSGKRSASVKDRRAISALTDALRTGSLRRTDQQGAVELLSRTLPDVGRLPQHALRLLAKNALKQACKVVPPSTDEEKIPSQSVPAAHPDDVDGGEQVQKANSNDLLPSIRPKTPVNLPSGTRKRRRVSRAAFEGASTTQSYLTERPNERLDDVGGISAVLDTVRELVEWPLAHSNVYEHLGVDPPRGILLHGPPGCGKTLLAHAIAGELGVSFLKVSGPEIVSGMSGESERKLRDLFTEAVRLEPSIIFVDEVDAIASRREVASKEMERRIVSQLLSCVDSLGTQRSEKDTPDHTEDSVASGVDTTEDPDVSEAQMEERKPPRRSKPPSVVIIAATNRPESLEPALRRAGRFDREIELGAPDEEGRAAILSKLCRRLRRGKDFEIKTLAKRTAGYVGADLHLLTKEAGLACVRRFALSSKKHGRAVDEDVLMKDSRAPGSPKGMSGSFANGTSPDCMRQEGRTAEDSVTKEAMNGDVDDAREANCPPLEGTLFRTKKWTREELEECGIEMCDFEEALTTIQPSALREGFATRPNVSWDNVGSLEAVREEMMMAVVEPIRRPEMFSSLGLHAPAGVLLYGPPGCGKTLLARAVASESGANFISVKGPELLSKYVGDSELAVRKVFARARSSAPCVIFFDELDALAPRRGGSAGESSGASERVVNMLLTEMDGFSDRKQVFLIAATNRPDIIDPAMLRPGRLDKLVYVPLPDSAGRVSILQTLLRGVKVDDSVNVEKIAGNICCEGFSGADMQALIRVAGESALRETMRSGEVGADLRIEERHFEEALKMVLPSVSARDAELYRGMEGWLRKTRGKLQRDAI